MIRLGTLRLEILSCWRSGTGEGRSAMLDATCLRDEGGMPYVPGRHLRGLLKDSIRTLEILGVMEAKEATVWLFGENGFTDNGAERPTARQKTQEGLVWVDSAVLPAAETEWLRTRQAASNALFATVRSTAIERKLGTTLEGSLRSEEVAIPLMLEAPFGACRALKNGEREALVELVRDGATLMRGIGSKRNRGLGRCIVTVEITL
jgi:hypothetical protein